MSELALAFAICAVWDTAIEAESGDVDRVRSLQERLHQWREAIDLSGVGCLQLKLDELLHADPEKEQEFIRYLNLAREKLQKLGDQVPGEYLRRIEGMPKYNYEGGAHTTGLTDVIERLRTLILDDGSA